MKGVYQSIIGLIGLIPMWVPWECLISLMKTENEEQINLKVFEFK